MNEEERIETFTVAKQQISQVSWNVKFASKEK